MQRKWTQIWWSQGIIEQDRTNGDIVIRQGSNVVIVHQNDRGAFAEDFESVPEWPPARPAPGFGGGAFPVGKPMQPKKPDPKPKKPKSMDDIVQDLKYIAHGWKPIIH